MSPFCAAIDWGTTSFRIWLLGKDGTALASRRSGEGMKSCSPEQFPLILESHLQALGASQDLPAIICGMAGARQGWMEAPYSFTPVAVASLARSAVRIPGTKRRVRILPGIAQRDPDEPEVMRGEETQLLGVTAGLEGDTDVCLPGTHSKWVRVKDGAVTRFRTYLTGELFGAIRAGTIIARYEDDASGEHNAIAFAKGVRLGLERTDQFTASLFSIRSGELLGFSEAGTAVSILSGLLIGTEIGAARSLGFAAKGAPLQLVVSGPLGQRYADALAIAGVKFTTQDAEAAVIAGLHRAALASFSGADTRRA